MSVSTKENTLALATGVTGDNQMQEKGQIESKPSPHQVQGPGLPSTAGSPREAQVSCGSQWEKGDPEKHLFLSLCFHLFCNSFWNFFFFSLYSFFLVVVGWLKQQSLDDNTSVYNMVNQIL